MLTPEATVLLLCWHSSPPLSTAKAPLPLLCRYRLIPQPTRYIPVSFSFLGETVGRSSPPGRKVHQRRARGSPPRLREHKLSSRLIPVQHRITSESSEAALQAGTRRTLGGLTA